MQFDSRRDFLLKSSWLTAGVINLNARAAGANDRINIALIGGRSQGKRVALRTIQQGGFISDFCDVDEAILGTVSPELEKAQNHAPNKTTDYRRILDNKNIDAVIIAAPDHWHTHMAIAACQAGKDVYVEKPLSQTLQEGAWIEQAARKYNRIMQVGTHRRSIEHFHTAADYVASGKLGKLCLIKAWICQVRGDIGTPVDSAAPSTVNYDQWLGPAPKRPFNVNRFHYNWRFFWDYGNTELGNQGVHLIDAAMIAIEKILPKDRWLPKQISSSGGIYWLHDAKEVPDTQITTYDFGDFLLNWELRSFEDYHGIEDVTPGTAFYGTDASLVVDDTGWRVYAKGSKAPVLETKASGGSHEKNFLDSLRSRKRPSADVEFGRLSTTMAHLGNISQRLKRSIVFDPSNWNFGKDAEANQKLSKTYRKGFEVPKV